MVAFIFPGQGAQYVGMGKDLYQVFPESKQIFERADSLLGFHLSQLCFEGPFGELTQTKNCQPAIFTTSIAALEAFKSHAASYPSGITYTAGLSLGEYTALVAAESLTFEKGLLLVAKRAQFMEEAARINPGKMASIIGLDLERISAIAKETGVSVANLNCPGQQVISGNNDAVDKAACIAKDKGAKRVVVLDVSGASHSSLMQPASSRLFEALEDLEIKNPRFPVVSNVTATAVEEPLEIKDNLVKQLTSSILWEDSVRFMLKKQVRPVRNKTQTGSAISNGVKIFFEIGPGKVLRGLIRRIDPTAEVINIQTPRDILS